MMNWNVLASAPAVAPLAGAWIEMGEKDCQIWYSASLPLRERGLK